MRASQRFIKGLIYFPLKTNILSNERIRVLINDHGNEAFAILIFLWCDIYGNDYFRKFAAREKKLFCSDHKIDTPMIDAILNTCFEEELFDIKMFQQYEVLTSESIQETWLDVTNRRIILEVISDYFIVDVEAIYNYYRVQIEDVTGKLIKAATDKEGKIIRKAEPRKKKDKKVKKERTKKVVKEIPEPTIAVEPEEIIDAMSAGYYQDEVLTKRVMVLFGFGEVFQSAYKIRFVQFITVLNSRQELETFRTQFDAYEKYQVLNNKRYLHTFDRFIGSQSSRFTDGKWLERNWIDKLESEKAIRKNGNHSESKSAAAVSDHENFTSKFKQHE